MEKNLMKLIDVTEEHIELIYNWRNQPNIRSVMYDSKPINWDKHVAWFNSILKNDMKYVKIFIYDQVPYGVGNFSLKDKKNDMGEWGFYIGEQNAPKGMGTALAYKMLEYIFEDLNIRKLCAEVLDYNENSIKFHEKVGFQKEGILREHIYINNSYCDIHLFSYFKKDWNKSKAQLEKYFN